MYYFTTLFDTVVTSGRRFSMMTSEQSRFSCSFCVMVGLDAPMLGVRALSLQKPKHNDPT